MSCQARTHTLKTATANMTDQIGRRFLTTATGGDAAGALADARGGATHGPVGES